MRKALKVILVILGVIFLGIAVLVISFNLEPIVRLDIPRERIVDDEEHFTEFISYLKDEGILQNGQLIVSYVAETGEILEDEEWSREI